MDGLRKLIARIFARNCSDNETVSAPDSADSALQAVAKVQAAIQNGEQSQLPMPKSSQTLRRTLNDVPPIATQPTHSKDRPWFDGRTQQYQNKPKSSDTFNRLEAFLSTTDPNRLTELDPNWNKMLEQAPDEFRPQPKRPSIELPKIRRTNIENDTIEPLPRVLSESLT